MQDGGQSRQKYMQMMQRIANKEGDGTFEIHLGDLESFFDGAESGFVDRVKCNTKRYVSLFQKAIDDLMPERNTEVREGEKESINDIYLNQRRRNIESNQQVMGENNVDDVNAQLPPELM